MKDGNKMNAKKYRVLAPWLDVRGRIIKRGAVVDDLPAESVVWLLEVGSIEVVTEGKEQ